MKETDMSGEQIGSGEKKNITETMSWAWKIPVLLGNVISLRNLKDRYVPKKQALEKDSKFKFHTYLKRVIMSNVF